jgi:hypothetical protein
LLASLGEPEHLASFNMSNSSVGNSSLSIGGLLEMRQHFSRVERFV